MKIIKHNKNNQEFSLDKLSKFLDKVFYGLKISKQDLLNDFESTLFGKKSVDSLDMYDLLINTSLKKCVFTGSNFHDLEWSKIAQRLKLKKLYKEIAITRNSKKLEPYNNFSGFINNLNHLIEKEIFSKELNHLIGFYNIEIYYKIINPEFDNNYDFAGFNLLCDRYLTEYEGKIVELPQELYLIIAMLLANTSTDYYIKNQISEIQDNRAKNAIPDYIVHNEFHYNKTKEFYEAIASGKISLATPILSNLRKHNGSTSSCFIDSINDSWLDIAEGIKRIGLISKNGGGVGVNINRIRASGSYVNKMKGASSGVINWIKLINDTGVAVNQNGCVSKNSYVKRLSDIDVELEDGNIINIPYNKFYKKDRYYMLRENLSLEKAIIQKLPTYRGFDNQTLLNLFNEYVFNINKNWHQLIEEYGMSTHQYKKIINKFKHNIVIPDGYVLCKYNNKIVDINYYISKDGDVINIRTLQSLCYTKNRKGYLFTAIGKSHFPLHRLIFHSFNNQVNPKLTIDHIDNDKMNNSLDNLREMTDVLNSAKSWEDNDNQSLKIKQRLSRFLQFGYELNGKRSTDVIKSLKYNYINDLIIDIRFGDYIMAFDGKSNIPQRVLQSYPLTVKAEDQIKIIYSDGSYLVTSKWHPLGIIEEGKLIYKRSDEIKIGEFTVDDSNKLNKIVEIDINPNIDSSYWDLHVENTNNYFSSTDNQNSKYNLTHNSRAGAVTVALDIWHLDIESFLDIQTENGDQRNKAYDIFPQVVISDLFMQRCENNEMWTLFDPYEVRTKYSKELCELWGAEFETFYSSLESEVDSGNIKLFNKISARELMKKIMKTTIETGMPYVFFKDTVNKANPNKNEGMIGNGNLCMESFSNFKPTVMKSANEVLNQGEIHVCSLASLNLSILLNLEDIKKYTRIEIEILDNIIDLTKSPIIEGDIHNNKYRIIGGGLMGYADHLAIKKIRYNDSKAVNYSKELAYNIYITAVEKSAELAKERGSYPAWKNAELPLLTELMEFPQNDYEDNLRSMILNYGLRNGSLLAIAPNTSTSVLLGCSSSFLPVFNKFFIDKNSKGSVPVYAKYLSPETFWYYQENKNLDQQHIINITSALQQWVDQGISMEWYIDVNKVEAIDFYNLYMNAWKQKCKTVYYIRQLKLKKEECISCAN